MNDFLYGANCLQFMYVVKWRRQKKNADMIMQGSCCKLVINVISFNPKKVKMIRWWPRNFSLLFILVNLCMQPPTKYYK